MLFRSKVFAKTWDTWAYYCEGVYYLYYLFSGAYVGEGFGVATSEDGVSWSDHGSILSYSDEMVRYFGSGSGWKASDFEQTGNFYCNYSEWHKQGEKNVQNILFARSKDLLHWEKLGKETIFRIDERYYKKIDTEAQWVWQDPRWDGISVIQKPGGGYYGFWTATPIDRFSFGFGISEDGLHWQALEPPVIEWDGEPCMRFIEVGGVERFGNQYFAMLGDYASDHCGMFTFIANAPQGPYRLAPKNFDLLRNRSRMHVYFSRFFQGPEGILVNHHAIAEGALGEPDLVVYNAPFKRAIVEEGTLYLKWWEPNEKIKGTEIDPHCISGNSISYPQESGIILEGKVNLPGSLSICTEMEGKIILSINAQGVVKIGKPGPKGDVPWEEYVDRQVAFGPEVTFRLLLNKTMLEFYIEDYLMQCYTFEQKPAGYLTLENATDLHLWWWQKDLG